MSERPRSASRRAPAEVNPSAERSANSNDNSAPSSAVALTPIASASHARASACLERAPPNSSRVLLSAMRAAVSSGCEIAPTARRCSSRLTICSCARICCFSKVARRSATVKSSRLPRTVRRTCQARVAIFSREDSDNCEALAMRRARLPAVSTGTSTLKNGIQGDTPPAALKSYPGIRLSVGFGRPPAVRTPA